MAKHGQDKLSEAVKASPAKVEDPNGAFASQLDLIALSHEPVFAWDWDLGVIDWNAGAERQYGFTRSEALGKNSHELLASKHPVSLRRFLKKLTADGYWAGEVRHTTKDGKELIIESRQQVIAQNGRKIVIESNRDISERRAGESQIAILIIIGDLIRTTTDPDELLNSTTKTVGLYFNARRCVFNEVDLENDLEIIHRDYRRSGRSVAGKHKLSAYSALTFEDLKAGRIVRNGDSKSDPRTAGLYAKVYEPTGERSYVAVPLMREGQWKRTLWISDDQPREWSDAEVALLEVIAERVWLAVEKRRSEEFLRASRAELDLIVTGTPFMLTRCSSDLRYKYVSRSYAEMLGRWPEDLINMPIVEMIGKDGFETIRPRIEAVLCGESVEFEDEVSFLGAGSRHLRVSYTPERDGNNKVVGWIASIVDISGRVRAENSLRESEESYRILTESASDAILSIDESSTIGFVNTAATRVFGYAENEMTGQSLTMLMPEKLRPLHRAGFGRYLKTGVKNLNWESVHITARHKDGRHFPIEISFGEYNRDGKRLFIGIARDVTEKQRQAEELQKAHDELEARIEERTNELAELNAALIEEMREREIAEKQRIELLGRLVSSQEFERRRLARDLHDQMGQRLTALRLKLASLHELVPADEKITSRINRLEAIAEQLDSEVGFLSWELRPAALDDLGVVEAIKTFVNEWARHFEISADFHSSGLPSERLGREVETHIYRITQEALNNIAKHAEAKDVTVLLEKREQNIMLIIEDDGKGFDSKEDRALGEYGAGLGLTGMSERAALVGGEIEIESAPGSGTTIYVRIPYSKRT